MWSPSQPRQCYCGTEGFGKEFVDRAIETWETEGGSVPIPTPEELLKEDQMFVERLNAYVKKLEDQTRKQH